MIIAVAESGQLGDITALIVSSVLESPPRKNRNKMRRECGR
jgi:hypothetical protein